MGARSVSKYVAIIDRQISAEQDLRARVIRFQNLPPRTPIIVSSGAQDWVAEYDRLFSSETVIGNNCIVIGEVDPIRGVIDSVSLSDTYFSEPPKEFTRTLEGKVIGLGHGIDMRRFAAPNELLIGETEVGEFLAKKGFCLADYRAAATHYAREGTFTKGSDHVSLFLLKRAAEDASILAIPKFRNAKAHLDTGCKMCNYNLKDYKTQLQRS